MTTVFEKVSQMLDADYNGIISDAKGSRISPSFVTTFLYQASKLFVDGVLEMSHAEIASAINMSHSSVGKVIDYLKHKGVLFVKHNYRICEVTKQSRRSVSTMFINLPEVSDTPEDFEEGYIEKVEAVKEERKQVQIDELRSWTKIYRKIFSAMTNNTNVESFWFAKGRPVADTWNNIQVIAERHAGFFVTEFIPSTNAAIINKDTHMTTVSIDDINIDIKGDQMLFSVNGKSVFAQAFLTADDFMVLEHITVDPKLTNKDALHPNRKERQDKYSFGTTSRVAEFLEYCSTRF